jgi:hypothetical protein
MIFALCEAKSVNLEQQQARDLQSTESAKECCRSTRPGAIRMARLRDHRQRRYQCVVLEISVADIDGLITHGLLDRLQRDLPDAVEHAIGNLLDRLSR